MAQPGLDDQLRNRNGDIGRQHGNTPIGVLRRIYGRSFAKGMEPRQTLAEVLEALDEPTLSQLVRDHRVGTLAPKIRYVAGGVHP